MLKIDVRGDSIKAIQKDKDRLMDTMQDELLDNLRRFTPIDQGFARRSWFVEKLYRYRRLVNRAPYIESLERGHSRQAPRGITKPAIEYTLRRIK